MGMNSTQIRDIFGYEPDLTSVPPLHGIIESALYVHDLPLSVSFYGELFGFPPIFEEAGRLHAFAVAARQVLLLFQAGASVQGADTPGGRIPGHDAPGRSHLAFGIPADAEDGWRARLQDRGVPIESTVVGPGGCHSLYFRDPDGHLLELITPGCWKVW